MQISIVASAVRPKYWGDFLKSLEGNKCEYEVIFVGNVPPYVKDGSNPRLKWMESSSKETPAECYANGFRVAKGKYVHYTADDAEYSKGCLDVILKRFEFEKKFFRREKIILEPFLYENYGNGWHENSRTQKFNSQRFSPLMAPFGFMSREWFNKLGGLDKNFTHGQYENDICLRAMQDGGDVVIIPEARILVDHFEKHGGVEGTNFSKGYLEGRKFLESCWILPNGKISKKRLKPVERYEWLA